MAWWQWSRTASSNATADPTINFQEGMSPSSVNDSARALMAAAAGYRDDICGAIVTGGTSTAYTLTSFGVFDTLAHMDGKIVAFTPHTTNDAAATLNVDGLGAKALRSATGAAISAGVIVQGTPYVALYNNANSEWLLHGFFGNPYNVPLGAGLVYTGATAPNSNFVLPYGQAISRTTYASYFSLVSTLYGTGDGSTTFNVPDFRGRTPAAPDNMGGSAASRLTSYVLGSVGGLQTNTLLTANLPAYTPSGSISVSDPGHTHTVALQSDLAGSGGGSGTRAGGGTATSLAVTGVTATFNGSAQGGSSSPVNNIQPTIAVNYILRVI